MRSRRMIKQRNGEQFTKSGRWKWLLLVVIVTGGIATADLVASDQGSGPSTSAGFIARGWSAEDALGPVAGVLILGCLGSCAAVWLIETRASRDLEQELTTLGRRRSGRDAGDTGEDR